MKQPRRERLGPKDWLWIVGAGLGALLVLMAIHRLLTAPPAGPGRAAASGESRVTAPTPLVPVSRVAPVLVPAVPQPPSAAVTNLPPGARVLTHEEEVHETVAYLRQQLREDPSAPGVLSEAEIQVLEKEDRTLR